MQNAPFPPRSLLLSPPALSVSLAVLAFLHGLFAWPLLALKSKMGGENMGYFIRQPLGEPGPRGTSASPGPNETFPGFQKPDMPDQPMPFPPMPGGPHGPNMYWHHVGIMGMMSPFTYVMIWLATVVVAAIAGAILAWIYNLIVARLDRANEARATA